MFQELHFGPWPQIIETSGAVQKGTKLVEGIRPSSLIKAASIRRPDKTASFREEFEAIWTQPGEPINDDPHLSLLSVPEFRSRYWGTECFSKLDLADKSQEQALEDKAIEKLIAKEESTREVNQRLRAFRLTGKGLSSQTAESVRQARRTISHLLGPFTWDRCVRHCRWGPGASTEFNRKAATPQNKWDAVTHVTEECQPLAHAFSSWAKWEFSSPVVVDRNRITTVPKKTTARRTIACEPTWNMFFQLGIEGEIRRCLQKAGLLVDQRGFSAQDRHQRLARAGSSRPGLFPTLDFSDASNSISNGLCGLLLPDDWLEALCRVRCRKAELPDSRVINLEMFSTMGNGFTFVLMTLLIWAIARATVQDEVSVFGDDLILPDERGYDAVVEVFRELGFELNSAKSFVHSQFRESCGGHFFNGCDVTPPYFRSRLLDVPSFIKAANRYRERTGEMDGLWHTLVSEVPRKFRGPSGYGDGVAVVPWDMATPHWSTGRQCWSGTTIVGFLPTRDGSERGRLRHGLYPVVRGEGPEVYRKVGQQVAYRTGNWNTCRW